MFTVHFIYHDLQWGLALGTLHKVFKNIRKSGIFRVASHLVVFPCADAITWILKNIDVNGRYICNDKKYPIASLRPEFLEKCYHIDKGTKMLDNKMLDEFEYTPKDLFLKCYKVEKQFEYIPKGGYPRISLRKPYQYLVVMLCLLYGDPYASQFDLSYIPLIYYCAEEGVSFNWDDMLSKYLTMAIFVVK
jgi:hypothetical protein